MRRILVLLLALLVLAGSVSAQAPSVVDKEGLLKDSEIQTLETSFNQYHEEFAFTVAAATAESFGELTPELYARKVYMDNGYDPDGTLLLISEAQGCWYLYTSGICAQVISDSEAALIGSMLQEELEAGNYYDAFKLYGEKCTAPVCERINADAIAAASRHRTEKIYIALGLFVGLVAGLAVSGLLALLVKLTRKKKKPQPVQEPETT